MRNLSDSPHRSENCARCPCPVDASPSSSSCSTTGLCMTRSRRRATSSLSVADMSSTWQTLGSWPAMAWMSCSYPKEKSRSASSNTTTSTLSRSRTLPSERCCCSRAGVAMRMCGRSASRAFCVLTAWSAVSAATEMKVVKCVSDTNTCLTCSTNSLVGTKTTANGPLRFMAVLDDSRCSFEMIFWRIGSAYAPVLPDPVRALARTSLPRMASGIAFD
mmetsp:Transcript_1229/g.3248  ORF Transcript_1229/g.3248 Transcript_1229/m.3248 type:complete len:218 (+) Transcript_1229:352-1005(+)